VHARMAFAAAGVARVQRGDDDEAFRLFAQGLAADVGGADPASTLALRLGQTLVAVSRGRQQAALLALQSAHEVASRTGVPPLLRDLALRAVTEVQLLTHQVRPWLDGRPETGDLAVAQVARARLMVATGRAGAALPIVRDVLRHAGPETDALTRTEALVAHATVLAHLARSGVDDALAEALVVAGPDRLARPFLAARDAALDERLGRLVALRPGSLAGVVRDRLGPSPAGPEPEPLLEPLTERELAMLAALPTMESNTEIAADFYVSVNTVKAHLKALYRKLGVGTRREAVRRGRELGLLD
jgi:LuxR family transcriptional regulator, maltose regulon positive regulatory protein